MLCHFLGKKLGSFFPRLQDGDEGLGSRLGVTKQDTVYPTAVIQ